MRYSCVRVTVGTCPAGNAIWTLTIIDWSVPGPNELERPYTTTYISLLKKAQLSRIEVTLKLYLVAIADASLTEYCPQVFVVKRSLLVHISAPRGRVLSALIIKVSPSSMKYMIALSPGWKYIVWMVHGKSSTVIAVEGCVNCHAPVTVMIVDFLPRLGTNSIAI